jgi:UDP-glucose 4-epimerase
MPLKVLVTGGCGYIGSHTILDLLAHGYEVLSVDSHIRSSDLPLLGIEKISGQRIKNYAIDLCDAQATAALFEAEPNIGAIIHFAALKSVPESVAQPLKYYHNNIQSLVNVLDQVAKHQIPHFVFSSSCSVYGNTAQQPVLEDTPFERAESPYAYTKQVGERMVSDFMAQQAQSQAILLRYFNPAGAHPSGLLGEMPQPGAYNLVPILIETLQGIRPEFTIFGNDYPTRDGTCVRDYIHIMDLAHAHTLCLDYLRQGKQNQACEVFNVGIGQGVTVLEALHAFEQAVGQKLPYRIGPRRAGDVASIYANYQKAAQQLNWQPQYNIQDIMKSAWAWEQAKTKSR